MGDVLSDAHLDVSHLKESPTTTVMMSFVLKWISKLPENMKERRCLLLCDLDWCRDSGCLRQRVSRSSKHGHRDREERGRTMVFGEGGCSHEYQVDERKGQPMETTMVLSFMLGCREREGLTHGAFNRNKLDKWKELPAALTSSATTVLCLVRFWAYNKALIIPAWKYACLTLDLNPLGCLLPPVVDVLSSPVSTAIGTHLDANTYLSR